MAAFGAGCRPGRVAERVSCGDGVVPPASDLILPGREGVAVEIVLSGDLRDCRVGVERAGAKQHRVEVFSIEVVSEVQEFRDVPVIDQPT